MTESLGTPSSIPHSPRRWEATVVSRPLVRGGEGAPSDWLEIFRRLANRLVEWELACREQEELRKPVTLIFDHDDQAHIT